MNECAKLPHGIPPTMTGLGVLQIDKTHQLVLSLTRDQAHALSKSFRAAMLRLQQSRHHAAVKLHLPSCSNKEQSGPRCIA